MQAICSIYTESQNAPSRPERRLFEITSDEDAIAHAIELHDWNASYLEDEPEGTPPPYEIRAHRDSRKYYGDICVSAFFKDKTQKDDVRPYPNSTHVYFTFLE
jgi:hypothetical protein